MDGTGAEEGESGGEGEGEAEAGGESRGVDWVDSVDWVALGSGFASRWSERDSSGDAPGCDDGGVSLLDDSDDESASHCVHAVGATCEQRMDVGPCTSQKCVRDSWGRWLAWQ